MGIAIVSVVAGVVPMLLYPLFLYWMDRFEKEPLGLLLAVFAWGFVPAAVFSLITQVILDVPLFLLDETGTLSNLVGASIIAPITEEFFKGLAVWLIYLIWRREFDGVFDGIIYGSLVGFGFAAIENILYFLSLGADPTVIVLRAFVFGLNHAFYTSLTGIGFGIARHTRGWLGRQVAPLLGLMAAMGAHSLHNLTVSLADQYPGLFFAAIVADYAGIFFVLVVMILALRRERAWIMEQLGEEVGFRTLSEKQYHVAYSPMRRFGIRVNALASAGLNGYMQTGRFFRTLTELAYSKHAYARRGEAGAQSARIQELRALAAALSAELAATFS